MMRRTVTILTAVSTFAVLLAGTAAADEPKAYAWNNNTNRAGVATWTENGDKLTVCDWDADGHGVRGYIYRPKASDPENGTVLMKASDPKADDNCVAVSENISETIPLAVKACRYKGSWVGNCSWVWIRD